MAAYPDSNALYLCELFATDKYRVTEKLHGSNTFHHFSPRVSKVESMCFNITDLPHEVHAWVLFCQKASYLIKIQRHNSVQSLLIVYFFHFSFFFDRSPCDSAPCKNGAVCVPQYQWNSYHCECKPGFHGINCYPEGTWTVERFLMTNSIL